MLPRPVSPLQNEMRQAKAILEAVSVFSLTLLLIALVSLSPLGRWEREVSNRFFIEYAVMIAVPLLLLLAARRNLAAYGLSLRPVPYHLDIAATAFVPMAIASATIAFVEYRQWPGALILAAVRIVVLILLGWLLRSKPTANGNGATLTVLLPLIFLGLTLNVSVGNALSAIIFYLFFLGFGEELLFRGYIQSRLNAAFGKPFHFFGVRWGGGIVIAAALFGLMHALNIGSLVSGHWELTWWWGFWTFFGGLVLGFVREKSGSIVAPTILHGLPQAIAYAALGL
jgi:uncharacterized protein